jgi:hypothetical protein
MNHDELNDDEFNVNNMTNDAPMYTLPRSQLSLELGEQVFLYSSTMPTSATLITLAVTREG